MPGRKPAVIHSTYPTPQLSPSGPQLPELVFRAVGYSQLSQDKEKV